MAEEWLPIRALADRRGVTPDAVQKQLKRGRLDIPWRRTNTGRLEVLVDLDALPPMPEPDVSPVVAALEERIQELRSTIQRLTLERDAERAWLEHERAGRIADEAQHAEQLASQAERDANRAAALSTEMSAKLSEEANKTGQAQQAAKQAQQAAETAQRSAENLKNELTTLRHRGWLDRLRNLG